MNKKLHTGIVVTALLLVGASFWGYHTFAKYSPNEYVSGTGTTNATTGETSGEIKSFTVVDISSHNNAESCYSIIDGSVYDLTAWVNLHPGGKGKILSMCGIDGTEMFMNQHHGGKKFMTILARFKIGIIS